MDFLLLGLKPQVGIVEHLVTPVLDNGTNCAQPPLCVSQAQNTAFVWSSLLLVRLKAKLCSLSIV